MPTINLSDQTNWFAKSHKTLLNVQGGDSSNQIHLSGSDGTNILGNPWEDVKVSLQKATAGPNINGFVFQAIGAGKAGYAWFMPDNANDPLLVFDVQLPHGYKRGSEIRFHLHWAAPAAANSVIVYRSRFSIWNANELATDATALTFDTTVAFNIAAYTEQLTHLATIPGTNLRESSVITIEFYRKNTDAASAFTGDILALSADFHVQMEKRGTVTEIPT